MVIAAAKTGKANINKKAVTNIDQTNKGMVYIPNPRALIFPMVTMKLIAPNMEEAPDKCKLKMARSTAGPECAWIPESGG
jgi:hypothetical protein